MKDLQRCKRALDFLPAQRSVRCSAWESFRIFDCFPKAAIASNVIARCFAFRLHSEYVLTLKQACPKNKPTNSAGRLALVSELNSTLSHLVLKIALANF